MKKSEKIIFFIASMVVGIASIYFNNVVAAIIAVFCSYRAFKSIEIPKEIIQKESPTSKNEISNSKIILSISFLIYSIILCFVTVYLSNSDSFFTLSLVSWISSLILLIIAGIYFDQKQPFNFVKRLRKLNFKENKEKIIEILAITIITLLAFYLRIAYLDIVPVAVHGDEGEMGMEALRVLGIGEPLAPFRTGWGPLPNLFYYLMALTIKIFGRNEIGLRMLSPIFGAACVPLIYYIGKLSWGRIAGFTGAWLIAVSHFHIQYSRLGLNNIESAFFMILFVYLILVLFKQNNRNKDLIRIKSANKQLININQSITINIFLGLTLGLSQYFYVGSRLILIFAIPILLFLFYKRRIHFIEIIIIICSFMIVIAPLGYYYLEHPNDFTTRLDTVSIFNPENIRNKYGEDVNLVNGFSKILLTQTRKNLGFFLKEGDISDFYNADVPGFDFLTSLFFWLGLGVILSRIKRFPEFTILIWLCLGIIFGGIITNNPPYGARLLITTSTVYIIGGVFIQEIYARLNRVYKKIPNNNISLISITTPIFVLLMISTLLVNYDTYFNLYPATNHNILSIKVTQEIIKDEPTNHIYLFGEGNLYVNHGTIRFLAGVGKATDLKRLEDFPPLRNDGKGIIIYATPSKFEEFKQIGLLHPEGELINIIVNDQIIFKKFKIPAEN